MKSPTLFLSLIFGAVASLPAQRVYVDASASPGGDGGSWSTAFSDLDVAILAARSNTEFWVAAGSYYGGFSLSHGARLYGGFRSGDTALTQRDPVVNPTILDGLGTRRVVAFVANNVLDGFIIQNGLSADGGGARVRGTDPTIRNCLFRDNRNSGGRGAALLVTSGGDPVVENCIFAGNDGPGHTIDLVGCSGTFDHIVVFDNVHNGLHLAGGATSRVFNSAFVNNTGRGICDTSSANRPEVRNNLFEGNRYPYHYRGRDYRGMAELNALSYASGNLSGDPQFVAPAQFDFRLRPTAPGIDAGRGSLVALGFYGNPRTLDGRLDGVATSDIGVHEFSHVELRRRGVARSPGMLTLDVSGTDNMPSWVLVGVPGSGTGPVVGQLGILLLDPNTPLVTAWSGSLPARLTIPIPGAIPRDSRFGLQSVAAQSGRGTLSNALDVRVE